MTIRVPATILIEQLQAYQSQHGNHTAVSNSPNANTTLLQVLADIKIQPCNDAQLVTIAGLLSATDLAKHLRKCDLSGNGLTHLPDSVADWTHVRVLSLSENQLTTLPNAVGEWTQLEELYLDSNLLTTLPDAAAAWTQVHVLYLNVNQFSVLPAAAAAWVHLQQLWLNDNQLPDLPSLVANWTEIQELYLNDNLLTKLPDAVAAWRRLQTLYLSSNFLTRLPDGVAAWTQLEELYLYNNQIAILPDAVAAWVKLQKLQLSHNQLTRLSRAMAAWTQLLEIDLDDNQLRTLAEVVAAWTQLQKLRLEHNPVAYPTLVNCVLPNQPVAGDMTKTHKLTQQWQAVHYYFSLLNEVASTAQPCVVTETFHILDPIGMNIVAALVFGRQDETTLSEIKRFYAQHFEPTTVTLQRTVAGTKASRTSSSNTATNSTAHQPESIMVHTHRAKPFSNKRCGLFCLGLFDQPTSERRIAMHEAGTHSKTAVTHKRSRNS